MQRVRDREKEGEGEILLSIYEIVMIARSRLSLDDINSVQLSPIPSLLAEK
jgi:hypothetical protein